MLVWPAPYLLLKGCFILIFALEFIDKVDRIQELARLQKENDTQEEPKDGEELKQPKEA